MNSGVCIPKEKTCAVAFLQRALPDPGPLTLQEIVLSDKMGRTIQFPDVKVIALVVWPHGRVSGIFIYI